MLQDEFQTIYQHNGGSPFLIAAMPALAFVLWHMSAAPRVFTIAIVTLGILLIVATNDMQLMGTFELGIQSDRASWDPDRWDWGPNFPVHAFVVASAALTLCVFLGLRRLKWVLALGIVGAAGVAVVG